MYIFKSPKYIRFCHFCPAQYKKNFGLRFCMIVRCIANNLRNYIQNFWYLVKISFNFLKNCKNTGAKSTSKYNWTIFPIKCWPTKRASNDMWMGAQI
jgi:hypothetical protein